MQPSLDETFLALGDPARLAVIRLLRKKPRRSSDIASALSLSRPTASRHLGVLRRAGLVEETTSEDDARGREYRLRPQPFARMRTWLDEVEAFWGEHGNEGPITRRATARRRAPSCAAWACGGQTR